MPKRDGWKTTHPDEQFLELVREVARLRDEQRYYTRLQGIRLESRFVGGERRLYAVVTDPNASNYNVPYQLAP
jgi:hypothetical protein